MPGLRRSKRIKSSKRMCKPAAGQSTLFCSSCFTQSQNQSFASKEQSCFKRQQKLYAEVHILHIPFYQKLQENLFSRYQKGLSHMICGRNNHLEPNQVAQQIDLANDSDNDSHCSIRNIWLLSRKLLFNEQLRYGSAPKRRMKRVKMEEKCLRTAVETWFHVNHDYLQEKLVCVPADYIETGQPRMQLHWRKLIIDWLFEFPIAFGVSMETVGFAINLFDRYLCTKQINKPNLQLCAIGCLLAASSACDHATIQMSQLVTLAEGSYTIDAIKKMQCNIESQLGKHRVVTCFHYLPQIMHYVSHLKKSKELRRTATQYLAVFLAAYVSLRYSPALVTIGAVSVALHKLELDYARYKAKGLKVKFVKTMSILTRFSQSEIQECIICLLMARTSNIGSDSD